MKDLKEGLLEYKTAEEFWAKIKREFRKGDEEIVKAAELKRLEQKERTMEKFVQKFKRVARRSRYEERSLVEEFKREINRMICQKLMKSE